MMKNKYILADLIFFVINSLILLAFEVSRVNPIHNDLFLVFAFLFFLLFILLVGGPCFGKIGLSLVAALAYVYVGRGVNLFALLSILILILFILYYFKNYKDYYRMPLSVRISGLMCLLIAYSLSLNYEKKIYEADDGFSINLSDGEYYDYVHFGVNDEEFVERFGMWSYLDKKVKNTFDYLNYKNKVNKDVNSFIERETYKETNEYTSVISDSNILIIQVPSLNNCYISKDLTPTIYRLQNEGLNFSGFDNLASKYDSNNYEIMTNLSLFPTNKDGSESYLYDNDTFFTTLPGVFAENGYSTVMYVNDYAVFYNREKMAMAYGYNELKSSYNLGLDGKINDDIILSDIEYKLSAEDKAMVFYTSTGNSYIDGSIKESVLNKFPNSSNIDVESISNLILLDEKLGEILSDIDSNITVVLYGCNNDLSMSNVNFAMANDSTSNSSMIIYNKSLKHFETNKKCSSLDILPTLANLYGFEIDDRFIVGRDILDNSYNGMIVSTDYEHNYFWYTDNIKFNFWSGQYDCADSELAKEEIKDMKARLRFSDYWFKYNKYLIGMYE
ncbi:MAG: hypothetical protein Q4B60_00310 [Erysipelotrichaceae bacterium]|nr:hypothetical protein [Erysipelotrichaceae bacterium]